MKKTVCLLLCALLLPALWGCSGEDFLSYYEMGAEVIGIMGEMAASDEYLELLGAPDIVRGRIESFAEGDHDDIDAVFSLDLSRWDFFDDLEDAAEDLSPELAAVLRDRMGASLATVLWGQFVGSEALAAASMVSYGTVYPVKEAPEEAVTYLYRMDGYPVLVSFIPGEGKTVKVSACYAPMELDCKNEDDVEDAFKEYFGIRVKAAEVEE